MAQLPHLGHCLELLQTPTQWESESAGAAVLKDFIAPKRLPVVSTIVNGKPHVIVNASLRYRTAAIPLP